MKKSGKFSIDEAIKALSALRAHNSTTPNLSVVVRDKEGVVCEELAFGVFEGRCEIRLKSDRDYIIDDSGKVKFLDK